MTTFKLYFSEENIRRIRLGETPSYEEFINILQDLYPKFHPELVIKYVDADGDKISLDTQIEWEEMLESSVDGTYKLWVEEGNGNYFKDGPEPETLKFYVDSTTKEAINVANEFMNTLQNNVPQCLASLFKSGKIIPSHIPEFLKEAVSKKYIDENIVDLDIDIPKLFDILHSKALNLLNSLDVADLEQGRDYLLATLSLVPDHMIALYNLACAEALLGNTQAALENLEKAIDNGYRNFEHMINDADFSSIRDTEAFQILAARVASLSEFISETPEEVPEVVPEVVALTPLYIPEPVVEPEPEVVAEPDLSASILPLKDSFASELGLLQEMGFTADPDVLLLLLEQFKGNVDDVMQFLLGFSS